MLCSRFFEAVGRKRHDGIQGARRVQRIVFVARHEHADGSARDFVEPVRVPGAMTMPTPRVTMLADRGPVSATRPPM